MANLPITFKDYLSDKFFDQHPEVLDDDMPDRFDDWLAELDIDEVLNYGEQFRTEVIEKLITEIGTHLPGEELSYCDTGEDMELGCRSECVDMAINRIRAKWLGKEQS